MSKSQPEQQPLPQSVILGCNAFNCASKISNANWETKLNEQVNVNQGDSIGVKASFIDTRGTASGNIIITKDTEISLEYYFYWMHTFNACDPSGITTSSADLSSNLTQQVLVGQSIPFLYEYANSDLSGNKIPAYITQGDPSGNFNATPINDADGLPYLVYQSSNVIPVAPVYGPTIPASQIVAGQNYVIVSAGVSTNWKYAGVPDASANVLPAGWNLNTEPFLATANPNGVTVPPANPFYNNPGMSPSEFLLPANVNPTLPYVEYMITSLGNTEWEVIDPSAVAGFFSASQMKNGVAYIIDNPGNINWAVYGAPSNATLTPFTCTIPPPPPPDPPFILTNAFFLDNSGNYTPDAGTAFGASPDDLFQCSIGLDVNGDYTLLSYSGSGGWCSDIGTGFWTIPPALLNFPMTATTSATNLIISGFAAAPPTAPIPVASLVAGSLYTVATTGINDGSAPPFTWNMVSNLPTTDTSQMIAGFEYQVYEYNDVVIPYAPNQGILTDVFISQGPIAVPPPTPVTQLTYTYSVTNVPDTPNFASIVSLTLDGVPFDAWTNGFVVDLEITPDANGNCYCNPANNFIEVPSTFFDNVQTVITTINGQAPGFPPVNVSFVSYRAQGDFAGSYLQILRQTTPPVPFPQNPTAAPSKLVQLNKIIDNQTLTWNQNSPDMTIADGCYVSVDGDTQLAYPTDVDPFIVTLGPGTNGFGWVCLSAQITSTTGPQFYPDGQNTYDIILNGPAQPGDPVSVVDLDFSVTNQISADNNSIIGGTYSSGTPANFPTAYEPLPFTASGNYTGTGSTSTANALYGVLNAATVSGTGFIQGSVYYGGPVVGSIIRSINPDPVPGSTGLAAEYPSPYSVNNVIYDGTVKRYTPPTFKTDIRPLKKIWKMKLKAGSYDPNNLAEIITRNMSRQKVKRVNNVTGAPFGTQSTLTVPTDSIYNTQTAAWANPAGGGQNTFFDSKNPKVYGYPSELDYNIDPDNDDLPFIFVPAMNSSYLRENPTPSPPDYIYAQIPHPNANGLNNIPNTKYFINLVPLLSDVRSVSPTIPKDISGGYYSILPFYSQNTVANGSTTGHGGIFPIAFGATQTSLLYNNEGNGLFSFNYLHSPILAFLSTASSDLTEVTAHMFTTQQTSANMTQSSFFTTLIDKKSGILLKDLQPRSFWSQLGFDVDALTVNLDDKPPGFQMTLNEFESKTTGGFCGSSNIFNGTFHTKGSADQPSVPNTELLFLTADVATDEGSAIIPFTVSSPNTTVGDLYLINNLGTFGYSDGDEDQYATASDWSQYFTAVNPGESAASAYSGMLVQSNGNWDGDSYYTPGFDVPLYWAWSGAITLPQQYDPPSVFIPTSNKTTTTQLQNNYFQVENTNTLNAVRIPTVRDQTGHFLIEITGYNSIYLDDKSKREIKSIVSSYFVSQGSFVAQVFPESYNYYHVGAPISLSNLKIRILDPYTMEEAQIGPNSSVYLQVNKMLSDIAVQQVEN